MKRPAEPGRGPPAKLAAATVPAATAPAATAPSASAPAANAPATSKMKEWADGQSFSTDERGEEQLLDASGTQVMMQWERPYMVRCIDALQITRTDSVLEIGFGCGYSADRIQAAKPRLHTIVECAEPVLERLRAWAAERPNVRVVEGTWQATLPSLGSFDAIFFDDFGAPGLSEGEMMAGCESAEYRDEYAAAPSHFHAFLQIALRWHTAPEGRLSGYLQMQTALDLRRDDVEVTLRRMPVAPPAHCHYFQDRVAIVPLIRKLSSGS